MELYLIRHTTPAVQQGVCYGQTEVNVTELFLEEAEQVRTKLAGIAPVACYSSPLQRCARLAATLDAGEPQHDARLKEMHFGDWEMQPWDNIPRQELDRWGNDYVDAAPPGGETYGQLHRRATHFLNDLTCSKHVGPVLVVTHAGVIRALLAEVLNLPLREAFRFYLDFGGVTKLRFDGSFPVVAYVNR